MCKKNKAYPVCFALFWGSRVGFQSKKTHLAEDAHLSLTCKVRRTRCGITESQDSANHFNILIWHISKEFLSPQSRVWDCKTSTTIRDF